MPPKKAPKTQSAQLSGAESLTTPALFIVHAVPPIFLFFLRPPLDVRRLVACLKINLISKGIKSKIKRQNVGVYLTLRPLDTHSHTGTEITIAFLTEKDRQMAEKRRKKWRPFCLVHLRRRRGERLCMRSFFRKKPTKTNARGPMLWPGLGKILAVAKRWRYWRTFFSTRLLVMEKVTRWRFCDRELRLGVEFSAST